LKSEKDDVIGHMIKEKCPKCGACLLRNKYLEKWCSMVGCDYGLNMPDGNRLEYMEKTMRLALSFGKADQKDRCERILEDLTVKLKESKEHEAKTAPIID